MGRFNIMVFNKSNRLNGKWWINSLIRKISKCYYKIINHKRKNIYCCVR